MEENNCIIVNGKSFQIFSVVLKGKKCWQVKIPVGEYQNGRTKYKTCTASNYSELEDKVYYAINNSVMPCVYPTFEVFVKDWLYNYKYWNVLPATFDKVESVALSHLIPDLGTTRLNKINESLIQKYIYNLSRCGNKKTNNGLSYNTLKKIISVLSEIIEYAVKKDYISKNFMKYITIPKNVSAPKEKEILSLEQLQIFVNELNRKDQNGEYVWFYRNAIRFMLLTGFRTCEVFGLKKDKIDYCNNCIIVERDRVRMKNRDSNGKPIKGYSTVCADFTKTSSSNRFFPMTKEIREIVDEQMTASDSEFLFPNKNGNIVKQQTFFTSFNRICSKAGVLITPHALRHIFATYAIYGSNISSYELSKLMGHSNSNITEKIYAHQLASKQTGVINEISHMFSEITDL